MPDNTSPSDDAILDVARALVASGRVVPGLTVDADGRGRSWWWPLPGAGQRSLVASLVIDPSPDGQRQVSDRLATAVDRLVRDQLAAKALVLVPTRRGRPTVAEAWVRSLTSPDPQMPASLERAKVAALAAEVQTWVASGAVVGDRVQLCLRIHEPDGPDTTQVELLVRDQDEPSLVVPLADVWSGGAPFAGAAVEEVLAALARLARLAPELAGVLDEAAPADASLDGESVVRVLRDRAGALEDAGIAVLLPTWWVHRPRLGLRAKASRMDGASATGGAGLGLDAIVMFTWEAALGAQRLTKRDLAALELAAAAKQTLVRLRGQWVEVDAARVQAVLATAGSRSEATARELVRAALGIDHLGLGAGGIGDASVDLAELEVAVDATGVGWLATLLDDAVHATVTPLPTPAGFHGTLRPYQERGAGWLAFLGRLGLGACLADDMGLGKTAQLIAAVVADPLDRPTLVVCPVSVLGNWERELARFAPDVRVLVHHGRDRHDAHDDAFGTRAATADVVLTTYSLVARDLDHLAAVRWGRLVLDEAQQVKNAATAAARAVRRLDAGRRVALTGTPVENRLAELWSIMDLLNPGLLGSGKSFREQFAIPIEQSRDPEAVELLRRVTGPFVLRRLKSDRSIIDDLPDKIETVDRCPFTREQATLYRAVVDDLLEASSATDGIERRGLVLAGLMRLKQVCNHPAHLLADGSPLAGRSGKLTRIEELLDEILAAGDKVLCFTQFTAWGELLRPHFERRFGVQALWLHGGVRRTVRDGMVEQFQGPDGPPLLLVSLKAGGTGLNLTAASHVVHLDRWWNPAVEDQATDRAYRIGQRRTVQVHKLVTAGTVEERIDQMIDAKRELASLAVGTGERWLTELSTDELRDLVALRTSDIEAVA